MPCAGHLARMHASLTTDAEVHPAVVCAYYAYAGAIFPAYECVPAMSVINSLCWVLLVAF